MNNSKIKIIFLGTIIIVNKFYVDPKVITKINPLMFINTLQHHVIVVLMIRQKVSIPFIDRFSKKLPAKILNSLNAMMNLNQYHYLANRQVIMTQRSVHFMHIGKVIVRKKRIHGCVRIMSAKYEIVDC